MTTFMIKLAALGAMVIDHTGVLLAAGRNPETMRMIGGFMRLAGRIAFPLYAFLIAEGCRRTKDIKKYMFRLLLFAVISEIPFNMFTANVGVYYWDHIQLRNFAHQNVFFTLFFGVVSIYIYKLVSEKLNKKAHINAVVALAPAFLIGLFADYFNTDYGLSGVLAIYMIYILQDILWYIENKGVRRALPFILAVYLVYPLWGNIGNAVYFLPALIGVIPVFFYNEKPGPKFKWTFYIAYPAHLLVLCLVWFVVF